MCIRDSYFPPITGTYLRLSRMFISLLSLMLTPIWLLLMQNPELIPSWLAFIRLSDPLNAVSYTHLDVYKRQATSSSPK